MAFIGKKALEFLVTLAVIGVIVLLDNEEEKNS